MSEVSVKKQSPILAIKNEIVKAKTTFATVFGNDHEAKFHREYGFAMMNINSNPKLMACEPASVLRSVVSLALMDLSLNPALKLAYLIPRGNQCTLDISYMGMIEVLIRSGVIAYLEQANVVYSNEKFEFSNGTEDHYIKHERTLNREGANPIGAYVIYKMKDGGKFSLVMNRDDILKRKAVAKSKNVWEAWDDEMSIKTVIRRSFNLLPKTDQMQEAAKAYDQANPVELKREETTSILD